jgi:hypothetical protein
MTVSVLDGAADGSTTYDFFGASVALGVNNTYEPSRTEGTRASTAVDAMAADAGTDVNRSSGFWEQAGTALLGYIGAYVAKDTQPQNGGNTQTATQQGAQQRGTPAGQMLPLLIVGGLIWMAARG